MPVIHGVPGAAQRRAVERNEAVLADREEWEGMTEWYCRACGCDWRGGWRRYKKRADGESLPS
ncbi:MAG TPA: hypothetical protein VNN77_16655 [candidate division Zixibacteria bacterium]|nr:hypothetical protein [candidate division Zixibacteria bacterium]